ncbi:MAG: 16S rRNA (cytosine(1402)-N(4))-methyltransferase RsmH [Oscillospiraceae bacterium]|nr:16S rRNA (cytosine(1402)-N(4))-methyltransferase RsmH [Oscillospiraceae bacterium]
MAFTHIPVLLDECMDALNIQPGGLYMDATAGLGGHSAQILANGGKVLCVDRDPQAIAKLHERFANHPHATIIHGNFFDCKRILHGLGISSLNGILADLGVSSLQLDDPSRGFSLHKDAPLDMRMGNIGQTAADAVNTLDERLLVDILTRFADEPYARRIARAIVTARASAPVTTTLALANIVRDAVPAAARRDKHPARRTFQALRIYINGELDRLPAALDDMFDCLAPGGRFACISFHSLEDRIVKQAFARQCQGCTCPPDFPKCVCGKTPRGRKLGKPRTPGQEELAVNPRSRSAKLRAIEKLDTPEAGKDESVVKIAF